jgi:P2-related tail formation protein
MSDSILPGSIKTSKSLAYEAVMHRLSDLDLSVLNMYDIDNVSSDVLYDLADQLNVLGLRGWKLASTDAQRRALIKDAIYLHQIAGTPFAIKRVLAILGYPEARIIENPGNYYNGEIRADGSRSYSGAEWGEFIVVLSDIEASLNQDRIQLILDLINEWKNARSLLTDLRIGTISLISNPLLYDGSVRYDGSQTCSGVKVS